jgi:heme exporter protein B
VSAAAGERGRAAAAVAPARRPAGAARQLAALVRKDLLLELRGRETVLAMATFALAAFTLVRFALGGDRIAGGTRAATGLLWVVLVFTALVGLQRAFAHEREGGVWDGLLAAPVDRALVWLAKTCATVVFLVLAQAVALPTFWLFFLQEGRSPSLPVLVAAVLLADVGMAALGALLAGLASAARAREVLLPVLFLPFAIPLVLGAAQVTIASISPQTSRFQTLTELGFLALYDTIFVLLGWALFEYVVEE